MCQRTFGCGSNPYETLWNGLKEALTLRIIERMNLEHEYKRPKIEAMQDLLEEMEVSEQNLLEVKGIIFPNGG